MIKKLCVTGIVVATAGAALMAAPAHADTTTGNSSRNTSSAQSGNTFGNVAIRNVGSGSSTNVNNVNGDAATATHGSGVGVSTTFD